MTDEEKKEYLMQYWISYSEQANEITAKRQTLNSIYLSLESALLGFAITYLRLTGLFLSIAGLIINVVWLFTLLSYKKLNEAKFKIINDMEEKIGLEVRPYNAEWINLKSKKYIKLTILETLLAIIMAILFVSCLIISCLLIK